MAVDTPPRTAAEVAPEPPAADSSSGRFRPGPAGWAARLALVAAVVFVVLVYPLVWMPRSDVGILALAVIFAIIGLSLNVLIGYTGQLSLGHQAFVGIGAFTSAYMVSVQGQPFIIGVLVAAAVGGLQALLLGVLALRVTGLYFALLTLSYGILAQESLFNIQFLTGGGAGQPAPNPAGPDEFKPYYLICLAFLGVVLWIDWRMMRTKAGRALLALRENPRVAASLGVNVKLYTLLGFVMSGVFAGVGGALLAHRDGFVVSDIYNFQLALVFVIMTVVGGLRSRLGIIIGSAIFALLGFLVARVPGLESAFRDWHVTLPVLVLIPAVVVGVRLTLRARRGDGVGPLAPSALVAFGFGALALLVLSPLTVPYLEARLSEIPRLTPEIGRLVIGPVLLLGVLTMLPGGIGRLVRPFQAWVRGGRFDWAAGAQKEVQITDVRA
jgi:branched-chain amino acid transport system permease protein